MEAPYGAKIDSPKGFHVLSSGFSRAVRARELLAMTSRFIYASLH